VPAYAIDDVVPVVDPSAFVPADMTVRDGYLALGSPAKEVRALTDAEIAWQANGPGGGWRGRVTAGRKRVTLHPPH
jgi:hypothetical protein